MNVVARHRRTLTWVALLALVAGVLVYVAASGGSDTPATRARDLSAELRCPDCESLSVLDSHTQSARAIRADILRRVEAGESDEEVRQFYVDTYGESILLSPEGGGLGVLVWGVPVIAVLLGGAGLVLALRRWQRQPRLHASGADEALVDRALADRATPEEPDGE